MRRVPDRLQVRIVRCTGRTAWLHFIPLGGRPAWCVSQLIADLLRLRYHPAKIDADGFALPCVEFRLPAEAAAPPPEAGGAAAEAAGAEYQWQIARLREILLDKGSRAPRGMAGNPFPEEAS